MENMDAKLKQLEQAYSARQSLPDAHIIKLST